ncbi:glycosyltransferase family 2 protein [Psychroserpens sp.]|uniref:glycosyltransferase family 2 protein n=1 Tax=Psychroserpens sp. TaxID=2020870 RepID=UPI002B2681ED|nr:glycosyltransferase family 2 protein [Psychroserpens sp.]
MNALTVIIPVYNGEKYLEEAIDSILNQTFTDFKLLVLNDNSSDSTPAILKAYQDKDSRVEVIHKTKNEGPANLRNEGIERAQTEFIALMDADDIALPTRFEKQLAVFNNNPNIGVCGTWFTFFGDKQKLIKHAVEPDALKVQFLSSCGIGNPTVMFRKSAIKDFRFEHQFVPAEDYGLWSEVIRVTDFYNIPESLLNYRWHPNNISQTKTENLHKANVLIKKRQLKHFGIDANSENMDAYLNAVSLKKDLTPEQVIAAIEASKKLKERNQTSNYYNPTIFESHIDKVIIRTIRNANNYNKTFYSYLKNESSYFGHIPFIDKMILRLKCLF